MTPEEEFDLAYDGMRYEQRRVRRGEWTPLVERKEIGYRERCLELYGLVDPRRRLHLRTALSWAACTVGDLDHHWHELVSVSDVRTHLGEFVRALNDGLAAKFVVTSHGKPRAVILDIDDYTELRGLADRALRAA